MSLERISVIIPTYNRPESLIETIKSLQRQSLTNFEIIVVDNSANNNLSQIIDEFNLTASLKVRYIPEPNLGLHNARHCGSKNANNDILVFTDDDATFDPHWLQSYAEAFTHHPEMVAAGGPVHPIWKTTPPSWILEYMGNSNMFIVLSLMNPFKEFQLDDKGYFFGNNMAIRRTILFEVGGFNPESFGDIWLGDGETGLNHKLWENGLLIGYVPDALVYHHIPVSRMTIKYFRLRMANHGACEIYSNYHKGIENRFRLLRHATKLLIKNLVFWIMDLFLNGKTSRLFLRIQFRSSFTKSQFKYLLRLMANENLRNLVVKDDWLNE